MRRQSEKDRKEGAGATGQAIKRIDGEIHKRLRDALKKAHQLYDQGKLKPAATVMVEAAQQVGRVRLRIEKLKALAGLPDETGAGVRPPAAWKSENFRRKQ